MGAKKKKAKREPAKPPPGSRPRQDLKSTTFRTTDGQRDAMKAAAARCGVGLSFWVREIGLAAAGASELADQMGTARAKHDEMAG